MKKTIGNKIKTLRIQFDLSQQQLAEKLYFSNRTISNWEKDLRVVSIDNLEKIAQFFNVPITYFTNDETLTGNRAITDAQPMKLIRVRKVELNNYFFYGLIGLMLLNIIFIFYPLGDRVTFAAINGLVWVFILIYVLTRFTLKQREQTTFYMVASQQQVYFSSMLSSGERKRYFFTRISALLFLLFYSMVFYVSVFGMINYVQPDAIFTLTVAILLFLITIAYLYLIVQTFIQDMPQKTMAYRHHDLFGLTTLRILMTLHYSGFIFILVIKTAYGHQLFPEALFLLNLVSGLMLSIALRIFYVYVIRFYTKLTLKTKI